MKKPHLDPENFSKYRPMSNLPFLAKVIAKVVTTGLNLHLEKHMILWKNTNSHMHTL